MKMQFLLGLFDSDIIWNANLHHFTRGARHQRGTVCFIVNQVGGKEAIGKTQKKSPKIFPSMDPRIRPRSDDYFWGGYLWRPKHLRVVAC